jgi:hypothetical protein
MAKQFSILCGSCRNDVGFDIQDVMQLEDHVDEIYDLAQRDTRSEVEAEFETFIDGDDLLHGSRPLQEMAIALRRGDIAEAERLLDGIADEIGPKAVEEVQQGRFSIRARRAA